MKANASQISVAARMGATDAELCAMFHLKPDELLKYSAVILEAKTEAQVASRYQKMASNARKFKAPAPKST